MQGLISVILVEHEPEVISLLSLSLSDMKECRLKVCAGIAEIQNQIGDSRSGLLLLNVREDPASAFEILKEVRREYPNVYVIVSMPEISAIQSDSWMTSGAYDCVIKDRNYVSNIVRAVKTALIRIAEKESIHAPLLSRAQHFAIDENLPDVIFSLDLEGKILYANYAITAMLGYQQNQVVGKFFSELISEDLSQLQFRNYLEHIYERINFRTNLLLNDNRGSISNFEINFTLIEGEMIYGFARKVLDEQSVSASLESLDPSLEVIASKDETDSDVLPTKVGPYRIINLLGAGAMGRVYKGFDEQLERYVAIKVTSKALDEEDRNLDRFRKEAKILASISHPNIALIYYFGSLEGMPYFCMEFLPNGSIENLLQTQKVIEPHIAISYVSQAAAGLREALAKGVLHMDVKPSNLMLTEDGRLKIVDFGLAHTNRDMEELERNIIGTPVYIAPEQIIGGSVDHRMDIYSLGISFFEMLYGFVPFKGRTVPDIFHQKLRIGIPPRSDLNLSIPEKLYEIVVKMTAREPSNRISHYSELIEALESIRRTAVRSEGIPAMKKPDASNVAMSGLLYDRSIPEVLGQISQERLNGKLTINWGQLYKQLHFKKGRLIAILSNQEGEDFVDLVISHLPADVKNIRNLQTDQSSDLYQGYTTVLQRIPSDMRSRLSKDFEIRARMILENLFSWMMGEFIFEKGDFPGQLDLEIQIQDVVSAGVRQGLDHDFIRMKLFEGNCIIRQVPDFVRLLREVNLPPSDRFLLFRFEKEIDYRKLLEMSRISEEEFARLLFLFHCFGLVHLEKTTPTAPTVPSAPPPVPPTPDVDSRPAVDPGVYYTHCAVKSFEQSNYFACVEYCKKALEHRQDPGVYRLMGKALASNPKFRDEAMKAYKQALSLSPGNAGIERDLADLRLRQSTRK
jgi:PAS domain S-box-containing protein